MTRLEQLRAWLGERVSGCSLAALRIAFGLLMLSATIRFAAMGWIDSLFLAPRFHFTYWGFGWVHPWPAPVMYAHFALLGLAALFVALGLFYRVAIVSFTLLFAYVELLDVTTYLNHYYAITLVGVLLSFLPAANVFSVDAWRARRRGVPLDPTIPRAAITLLQAQLGIIYFFAGVAKLGHDWLFRAEPLTTWLLTRTELPVIGPWLAHPVVPFAMSWAGMLFDLTIPLWLSLRRTRPFAYAVVVVFHAVTGWLFPIGMFPWVMIGLTPIFFDHDWPLAIARWLGRSIASPTSSAPPSPLARTPFLAMSAWLAVQALMPLRHHLYRGDVLYTEEGFRYAWLVMIVERRGSVSYRVVGPDGRTREASPSEELTPFQRGMMATQPDMILQYAHHLRDEHRARGEEVRVYADAFVSTNGRPQCRLVDPDVDLAAQNDSIFGFDWVLAEDDPRACPP